MPIAIVPGTFDPVHHGHVDVMAQAAKTFDLVYWAILMNSEKKNPMFSITERLQMLREARGPFDNVHVVPFDGLLVDAAQRFEATHIVRSLRANMDFEKEFQMTLVNRKLSPQLIPLYFPAQQEHFHISSTYVRELIHYGRTEELGEFVPQCVIDRLSLAKK